MKRRSFIKSLLFSILVVWNLIPEMINAFWFNQTTASGMANYWGDGSDGVLSTSGNVNLTAVEDGDMVVKNYTSLTVNSGHTMTTDNRCKGLLIYVQGDCTIDGTLTMSVRGAKVDPTVAGVSATGIRLPMVVSGGSDSLSAADFAGCGAAIIATVANQSGISGNGTIFQITRAGAAGGAGGYAVNDSDTGDVGVAGGTGGSGGGGGGGARGAGTSQGGAGAAGTCFSGGSAGGGTGNTTAGSGVVNGGAGGAGASIDENSCGGGTGNPGGVGDGTPGPSGGVGTGGLLIIVVGGNITIGATGVILVNGTDGVYAYHATGGASGGGNILILHAGTYTNGGSVTADGGAGGMTNGGYGRGGAGGAGDVQVSEVAH